MKLLRYILIFSGCILIILSLLTKTDGKMLVGVFLILTPAIINLFINTITMGKSQNPDSTETFTKNELSEE
jgi:hypothetical protein